MKLAYLAALFMVFANGTAMADDSLFTGQFLLCMDKSAGDAAAKFGCIEAESTIQDARLDDVNKKLGTQLTSARKKELIATERLWLQYRNANCGFYADPDGGTKATISASECVLQATAARAKELEKFLK